MSGFALAGELGEGRSRARRALAAGGRSTGGPRWRKLGVEVATAGEEQSVDEVEQATGIVTRCTSRLVEAARRPPP